MRCGSEYYDEIAQFNLAPVLLSLRAIYLFRISINKLNIEYNYAKSEYQEKRFSEDGSCHYWKPDHIETAHQRGYSEKGQSYIL